MRYVYNVFRLLDRLCISGERLRQFIQGLGALARAQILNCCNMCAWQLFGMDLLQKIVLLLLASSKTLARTLALAIALDACAADRRFLARSRTPLPISWCSVNRVGQPSGQPHAASHQLLSVVQPARNHAAMTRTQV